MPVTCQNCGREILFPASAEEMENEYQQLFPDDLDDERVTLCDECFQSFLERLAREHK